MCMAAEVTNQRFLVYLNCVEFGVHPKGLLAVTNQRFLVHLNCVGTLEVGAMCRCVASGTEADERMTDGELIYIRNRKAQK